MLDVKGRLSVVTIRLRRCAMDCYFSYPSYSLGSPRVAINTKSQAMFTYSILTFSLASLLLILQIPLPLSLGIS